MSRDHFDDDRRTLCDMIFSDKIVVVMFDINDYWPPSFFDFHSLHDHGSCFGEGSFRSTVFSVLRDSILAIFSP